MCPIENKLLNQNCWSWYHFSQEKLPHTLNQLLHPHIVGSIPFRLSVPPCIMQECVSIAYSFSRIQIAYQVSHLYKLKLPHTHVRTLGFDWLVFFNWYCIFSTVIGIEKKACFFFLSNILFHNSLFQRKLHANINCSLVTGKKAWKRYKLWTHDRCEDDEYIRISNKNLYSIKLTS